MVGQTEKPVPPGPAPSPALRAAVRLHQAGDLSRAEALYREAIAAAADDADALHLLGMLAFERRQYDKAAASIRRAPAPKPSTISRMTATGSARGMQWNRSLGDTEGA